MVTERNRVALLFSILLLVFYALSVTLTTRYTLAAVEYEVNQEWVQIWINKDGSIDIQYNITLTYTSGSPEGIVTLGMPKGGFHIDSAKDVSGSDLTYDVYSQGDFYAIDLYLKKPILLNKANSFIVYAIVPEMIYKDSTNPGNVGMQFYPSTFESANRPIPDVRIAIALPQGVKSNEVAYLTGAPFNNVFTDQNNLTNVYWERKDWPAAEEFRVGVSFPEKYVTLGPATQGSDIWLYATAGGAIVAIIAVIVVVFKRLRKAEYEKPRIAIEALGATRGLTAVEAAVVLDSKPVRVLTMILFGLLLKRQVIVTATDPLIRLQKLERPVSEAAPNLRYYEIDYMRAVEPDGALNEKGLAQTYLGLRDTVDRKLRGYSRTDTVNYYRSIANKAWEQVTQAGTPELKGDAIDKNIEWLLTDDKFDEKFRVAFPPDVIILPSPGWGWYWGGPYSPSGQARVPPASTTEARPIPAQEFANNIVKGLEKTSNNIVKNVQDFANRLVPAQPAVTTDRSVRSKSTCVCACAHCACACACVSCACACAHGGAR